MRRYGGTARRRIGVAAALKAVAVLVRRHPKVAVEMAAASVGQAGRAGISELRTALRDQRDEARPRSRRLPASRLPERGLSLKDRRKLRALLKARSARRQGDRPASAEGDVASS